MFKKILKSCPSFLVWSVRILLVLGMVVMIAIAGLLIRLSQGPMDLDFAKNYIEKTASQPSRGVSVKISHVKLDWPDVKAPLLLNLGRVEILKSGEDVKDEMPELSIDKVSVGLAGTDLLNGQLLNLSVIIERPTIQLIQKDGRLNLFWQDGVVKEGQPVGGKSQNMVMPIDKNISISEKTKHIRKKIVAYLEQLSDPSYSEIKTLSLFKEIQIKNAVIAGNQKIEQGSDTQYLAIIDLILRRNNEGLHGDLDIDLPGIKGKVGNLKADVVYRKQQKDLTFTSYIKDIRSGRLSLFFPEFEFLKGQNLFLEGNLLTAFDKNMWLKDASMDLRVPQGEIFIEEEYESPIKIENFIFNAAFNRDNKILNIKDMSAKIGDIPVRVSANASIDKGNITIPVKAHIDVLKMNKVSGVFPKSQRDTILAKWLLDRLKDGDIKDLTAVTNVNIIRNLETKKRDITVTDTTAGFSTDGLTVKYSDTLMPVTHVVGRGEYKDDILTITAPTANIGDVQGRDVKVVLDGLTADVGTADITLNAKGPLRTVFEYIYDKPISLREDLGFDPKKVEGIADFKLDLKFPLLADLPKEEVIVKVDGKVNDLYLPDVVKGLPLSGGPYDLSFKDGTIALKGSGQFDGRSIDLDYTQYLDPKGKDFEMKVIASLTTDDELRKKFGINLEDYIQGPLPVNFAYTEKDNKAKIDITGDATPTTLMISPFGYKKPPQVKGDVKLKVYLANDVLTEIDKLSVVAQGLNFADGRLLFTSDAEIKRGQFSSVTLGKTNVSLDFEITPQGLLKAIAKGSRVDISPFMQSKKKTTDSSVSDVNEEENYPMQVSVEAGAVFVDEKKPFQNTKIYLELDKQSDLTRIEMDATAGGQPMYIRFRPEDSTGERTFVLEAENGSAVLDILGIYSQTRGGRLKITGRPRRGDERGDLFGVARFSDFKAVKVPVLAKLLAAMSVQGVKNLMKEDEIYFSKLESRFQWRFRKGGNLLIVEEGRTSGSSAGLTFEGVVDQKDNIIDVSGTIIPLSGVNDTLNKIPVIGNLLGGEDGSLFAATYSLKGSLNDPKVVVNPLSVLAPGFLRKIFFEDDVKNKVKRAQ